jgi:cysteinyl-tRNA synthetase
MVEAHLGVTIDIHGGGQDLKFPHHENELAQSACAHGGAPLARFWLHNGFLDVEREKMSKSLGNVLLVHDLLQETPGEAIRYALLAAHYRKPLDWSGAGLARAKHALDRLYLTLSQLPGPNEPEVAAPEPAGVLAALEDDLNTPKAFAELFALARAANASDDPERRRELKAELLAGGQLLGLLQEDPESWLKTTGQDALDAAEIERLIDARAAARKARDFAEADRIRDRLAAEGVTLEDRPEGTRWRRAG